MSISARAIRQGGFRCIVFQTKDTMSEETKDQDWLDDVIDRFKMTERTGKSREELHFMVRKATICLNIAHCLSDVIDTLVMDAETILIPIGAAFEHEDKLHFKQLIQSLQDVQKCAKRTTFDLYHYKDADDYADECDWWYNMIRLICDRTGSDELKTKQVINWLITMPSVLNLFDVKKKDFIKIT